MQINSACYDVENNIDYFCLVLGNMKLVTVKSQLQICTNEKIPAVS